MKRMVLKQYGSTDAILIKGSYQTDHLPYQEIKTQWGSGKRKVSWNLPKKTISNNGGK